MQFAVKLNVSWSNLEEKVQRVPLGAGHLLPVRAGHLF